MKERQNLKSYKNLHTLCKIIKDLVFTTIYVKIIFNIYNINIAWKTCQGNMKCKSCSDPEDVCLIDVMLILISF